MALDFFEGLKVLDLAQGVSGPFCAKMFADLGAHVVKVEPPGGELARSMGPFPDDFPHPEKSGIFLALNTNKLGITLNLELAEGRALLLRLVENADLVIENFAPHYLPGLDLDFATFQSRNPELILTSLTPFGQSGPWADFQANNLLITNLSGFSRDHPGPVDDLERQPPLQLAAHQSDFIAGLTAAAATVTALNRRHQLGGGGHVDVSEMEVLSLLPQTGLTEYSRGNPPKGRHKSVAGIESLRAILPCRDGYVSISPRQQDQWERFVEMMGNPEWAEDSRFATRASRGGELVRAGTLACPMDFAAGKRRRLPAGSIPAHSVLPLEHRSRPAWLPSVPGQGVLHREQSSGGRNTNLPGLAIPAGFGEKGGADARSLVGAA